MTRRRREPSSEQLLRFIAEHESLLVTCDEFPDVTEERIREILREVADCCAQPAHPSRARAVEQPEQQPHKKSPVQPHEIFSDGAARGNPGPAGAGWIVLSPTRELLREGRAFLGKKTNNEAEYEALIRALQAAVDLGLRDVLLKSDSELLVRQINGQYQIRSPRLARLHGAARNLIQTFRRFEARHVPREENEAADALANRAIDEAQAGS